MGSLHEGGQSISSSHYWSSFQHPHMNFALVITTLLCFTFAFGHTSYLIRLVAASRHQYFLGPQTLEHSCECHQSHFHVFYCVNGGFPVTGNDSKVYSIWLAYFDRMNLVANLKYDGFRNFYDLLWQSYYRNHLESASAFVCCSDYSQDISLIFLLLHLLFQVRTSIVV